MKKIMAIVMAVLMVCALSLSVFADEIYVLEERGTDDWGIYANGVSVSGWYPSQITEYMQPETMVEFLEAIQTDGAQIEITADVECSGVLLQAYADGAYTCATTTENVSSTVNDDGYYVVAFDAATVIANYLDAGLSLDDVLNFGVDFNSGDATIYGIRVITSDVAETSDDSADTDDSAEAVEAESDADASAAAETTSSPDTGVMLAVLPMAVAAAAVVVSKKR